MKVQTLASKLPSALVICTKDRAPRVKTLLEALNEFPSIPKTIVVVDSSADSLTESNCKLLDADFVTELVYLRALPGAAHQKNVGLDYLEERFALEDLKAVHFLDDDCIPVSNYFATCLDIFDTRTDAVVVGGFDKNLTKSKRSRLRDLLLLSKGCQDGLLLRSGICLVPFPTDNLKQVDWVPGGMQNFRWSAARVTRFDGRVRIYGDEVEIQLRLAAFGSAYVSSGMAVDHASETIAKDSQRVEQSYMDGFRWVLARKYPGRVSKVAVIYTTFALMAGEAIRGLLSNDRLARTRFQGHVDFLVRLIKGDQLQQYVAHQGSGPFVSDPRD